MLLQNTLDLSTFEIVRFRIWNQTSQPSDRGFGSKYFNTNSGHEAYCREEIFTPIGWRTAAYMDDIDKINEKLDLIFGDELDTDTIIDSWKEVQDFLSGIEDTKNLMTMLDGKLDRTGGTITGKTSTPITIDTTKDASEVNILFKASGSGKMYVGWSPSAGAYIFNNANYRYIGILDDGTPYYGTTSSKNTLLHSGNVGDYALKTDGSNAMGAGTSIHWKHSEAEDWSLINEGLRVLFSSSNESVGNPSRYSAGLHIAASNNYAMQMAYDATVASSNLLYRSYNPINSTWGDWKTIAFTDSDITGNAATATKLETAVSLWGNEFDGTQSLDGNIAMANKSAIQFKNAAGTNLITAISVTSSDVLSIGYGAYSVGSKSILYGNAINFVPATGTSAMTITEEGNVNVGGNTVLAKIVSFTTGETYYNRAGANYLWAPKEGGHFVIGVGANVGGAYASLSIYDYAVKPGDRNNAVSLGTPSYRWSDVYSVLGNFSGRVLIGGAADDENYALKVNGALGINGNIDLGAHAIGVNLSSGWTDSTGKKHIWYGLDLSDITKAVTLSGYYGLTLKTNTSYGITLDSKTLDVSGISSFSNRVLIGGATDDGKSALQVAGLAAFNGGALIPTGQTLTIGSVTFRETAAGEVEVDGNLHTTGTLASGGKGEVGENTTGNAMVYQYDLASGESVYTVDNVKGSTNVIVQIFEWNSNTSSWDMILTDVSVKADAITVTFGRTTTVNHMVTVC